MNESATNDAIAALLHSVGQRYTRGRQRLVAALETGERPMTIAEILTVDPSLAQSSVYRNLAVLEEVGAVTRIVTSDDFARYELAEQLTEHHHHLICTSCGAVSDFSLSAATEISLDKALRRAARRAGFTHQGHRLDLLGLCTSCSSSPRTPARTRPANGAARHRHDSRSA
jgi:Fe2+ or Zn2+ uptake regulation protein